MRHRYTLRELRERVNQKWTRYALSIAVGVDPHCFDRARYSFAAENGGPARAVSLDGWGDITVHHALCFAEWLEGVLQETTRRGIRTRGRNVQQLRLAARAWREEAPLHLAAASVHVLLNTARLSEAEQTDAANAARRWMKLQTAEEQAAHLAAYRVAGLEPLAAALRASGALEEALGREAVDLADARRWSSPPEAEE